MFAEPALYFIMGTLNCGGKDPLGLLEQALKGGIDAFQLREKGENVLAGEELVQFARRCHALCREYGVPFLINDDVELAMRIGADGVHVGQDDLDGAEVRRIIGEGKILGVSVHSLEEAEQAVTDGADYVGMGPVYGTKTKKDANPPAGTETIRAVTRLHPALPVIGIGGITPDNAGPVWQAGASGIAVISALAEAEDINQQIGRFKAYFGGVSL